MGSFTNAVLVAKDKKIVIVAVPGAFTPTCSANHIPPFLEKASELKAKGVDQVVVIAHNDTYVMSGWGKANKISDEFVVGVSVSALCRNSASCLANCDSDRSSLLTTATSSAPASAGPWASALLATPLSSTTARSPTPRRSPLAVLPSLAPRLLSPSSNCVF